MKKFHVGEVSKKNRHHQYKMILWVDKRNRIKAKSYIIFLIPFIGHQKKVAAGGWGGGGEK